VLRNGKRIQSEHLELRGLASLSHLSRIGVIIPKYGHSAVERNQLKRRLREVIRIHVLPAVKNLEIVIKATPGAYDASVEQLTREMISDVNELSLLC